MQKVPEVTNYFAENSYKIFLQVIFPVLSFELNDPVEEPQEYVSELNDLCQDLKSDSIRCQCAKLLLSMCAMQDGLLTFCSEICIKSFIKGQLEGTDMQFLVKHYNVNVSAAETFTTSLVIIAVLAEKLAERSDIMQSLDQLFAEHLDKLLAISRLKVYLVYCCFVDVIFSTLPEPHAFHDTMLSQLLLTVHFTKK